MRIKILFATLLLLPSSLVYAQRAVPAQPQQQADAGMILANEIASIAQAVQSMNEQMKLFLQKSGTGVGPSTPADDKRQKIVAGLQALAAAEQRVIVLQNFQFDLTTKLNDTKARLSEIDVDLRPQRIDRSVQFEGTTQTEELRDARRQRLTSERVQLTILSAQLKETLDQNTTDLRDAQILARNLRRTYIPQIEREMSEP